MASHAEIPHENIELLEFGDLTVTVIEYQRDKNDPDEELQIQEGRKAPIRTASFQVDREILTASSPYFRAALGSRLTTSDETILALNDDSVTSMEMWLRLLHCNLCQIFRNSLSIEDWWHAILVGDKYGLDRNRLQRWFILWYTEFKPSDSREFLQDFAPEMLYPCFAFEYPEGFQEITQVLAYGATTHIKERNPTGIKQLHLPPRVIQQLNAARGRLRNILSRELLSINIPIIKHATCLCKEKTVFRFERELARIEVYPLEMKMARASVDDMISRLRQFNTRLMEDDEAYEDMRESCYYCKKDWDFAVQRAVNTVENDFDGLCLDCMSKSSDEDYSNHNFDEGLWDDFYRVEH